MTTGNNVFIMNDAHRVKTMLSVEEYMVCMGVYIYRQYTPVQCSTMISQRCNLSLIDIVRMIERLMALGFIIEKSDRLILSDNWLRNIAEYYNTL